MTDLQIKALRHSSELLRKFDTYPIYKGISDLLQEVPEEKRKEVLKVLQEETFKLKTITIEVKDWIDMVIKEF